jgi:hypothetical protein
MRDISYFQEYERRRAMANNPITQNFGVERTTIGTGVRTGLGVTRATINIDPNTPFMVANTGASYSAVAYPRYRLEKTYTFIGEVRVISDAHLQIQESPEREWVDVSQPFNYYT